MGAESEYLHSALAQLIAQANGAPCALYASDLPFDGPMPPPEEADLRALWVAGLICPLPGLAIEPRLELELECRPAILNAGTTLERVEAARLGIQRCIERLLEL